MRLPHLRFTVQWVAAAVIVVGIIAVLVAIERSERRRSEIAILRAEAVYLSARHARERAEVAVKNYAEGTFSRELATVEDEIKRAENDLNRIQPAAIAYQEWVERIRSKGYLLLIRGEGLGQLAVMRAASAVERAQDRKRVLENYTKVKALKKLNEQVAKAMVDELATKRTYEREKATDVVFIGKVMGRN